MVSRIVILVATVLCIAGCGSTVDNPEPKAAPKTAEQQIADIEARTDMPEDVKARTIESLKASANNSGK